MFNKITRTINQNRKQILLMILCIVFVLAIIQLLNYLVRNNMLNKSKSDNNEKTTSVKDSSLYSAISPNKEISENAKSNKETIETFLNVCNKGDAINAYSMLSTNCKSNLFKSYEEFYNNYYKKIFTSNRTYNIQNWTKNTFKVDIHEDILATGGTSSNNIQDFITVVNENNESKLNINNYIDTIEINRETEVNSIRFKIIKKDTYMKNEKYYMEITNNSQKDILLDDLSNLSNIYLLDEKDIKYSATNEGITKEQLYIKKGETARISIKFTNSYISGRNIKYIVFSNTMYQNEDGNLEKAKIEIKL